MSDTEFNIDTSKLTPANQNPWYILMTLYGEQEGDEIDWELHEKNRQAWNAWSCQHKTKKERDELSNVAIIPSFELEYNCETEKRISALFYENYTKRNNSKLSIEAPDSREPVKFNNTYFHRNLILERFVFSSAFIFQENLILSRSNLVSCCFSEYADFSGSIFLNQSEIQRSKFFDDAIFYKCRFSNISFHGCKFENKSEFMDAIFTDKADFAYTNFLGEAIFFSAVFGIETVFSHSNFYSRADFGFSQFGSPSKKNSIRFQECHFFAPTSFNNTAFILSYPIFSSALLHEYTYFSAFSQLWPNINIRTQPPHLSRDSCAVIRHILTKQGRPEDAHFFFRREMSYARQVGPIWQRSPYILYGWLSDFGYSILRPTVCLSLLWIIGFALIASGLEATQQYLRPLATAAALSFSNVTAQVVGFRPSEDWA